MARLAKPERVVWCDGSQAEYDRLVRGTGRRRHLHQAEREAAAGKLPRALESRPTWRAWKTAPSSARHRRTTPGRPTTGSSPREMRATLGRLFDGCMRGRTMYVVPFSMGPIGSHIAQIGVEISDSAYVAVNMKLMTRMGRAVVEHLGEDGDFVPCVHSVGAPLRAGAEGRRLAVQRQGKVDRAFSRDARDLVVRLRLRRQRAARQEVPRAAHRLGHGARRGLARRAHADPRRRIARGRETLRHRRHFRAPAARPISPC